MTTVPPPPSAPLFFSYSPRNQVILHSSLQLAQITSMIVPPVYLVSTLIARRRPFSVRGLMGSSMASTFFGGVLGGGLAWGKMRGEGDLAVLGRVEKLGHDATQVRRNDYSLISAALSGLIVPAIFLRRAPLPSLVLGGASIGLGAGVWTHLAQTITGGNNVGRKDVVGCRLDAIDWRGLWLMVDPVQAPEVPVIGGTDKRL
ncbi:hypothetical protein IAR55_005057 [Kwoniella newhampshirensis]|uniref:Transmembrane protein n=1 Tax=Kwoniella newhampshirensis TaxID=1651941 RepID=A0AAW0YWF5_9TREE